MGFKEYFLAQEMKMRGVMDLKPNPLVPVSIPKTGFRNSGAAKMNLLAPVQPYKPKPMSTVFRKGQSI